MLINAAGTLAFGGGGIAIVAYIYWKQTESLLKNHKEQVERICFSFEKSLDRRDSDIKSIVEEIRNRRHFKKKSEETSPSFE